MSRARTDRVVVHMSETRPDEPTTIADIRRFHMAPPPHGRGWRDVAYHFYIRRDGTVENGRAEDAVGAHAGGWNSTSVGICLEGGARAKITDAFEQHFTEAQAVSLDALIRALMHEYGPLDVYGHKDCPSCAPEKQCPGFDAGAWWSARA